MINETKQDLYTCGRFVPRGLLEKDVGQWDRRRPTTIATARLHLPAGRGRGGGGFDEDYGFYCEDADLCLRMILLGYRGLYVPGARAYHAWSATTGRTPVGARYSGSQHPHHVAQGHAGHVLSASLPKIVLYQGQQPLQRGLGSSGSVVRAWGDFLDQVPSTLRKRRRIMRRRAISSREFKAILISEYRFIPGWPGPRSGRGFGTGSPVPSGGSAATFWGTSRSRSVLVFATATGDRDARPSSKRRSPSSSTSGRTGRGASSSRSDAPGRGGSS